MNPDPQRVRAVSSRLSEAERLWDGLPSRQVMQTHLSVLQTALSKMLEAPTSTIYCADLVTTDDLGPVTGARDDELEAVFDKMGRPDAVTYEQVRDAAEEELSEWLCDFKVLARRRLAGCGYERLANPRNPKSGGWTVGGKNAIVYVRHDLTVEGRIAAVLALIAANQRTRGSKA